MLRNGIPTADHRSFADVDEALAYVQSHPLPIVVKDAGLRAGKGVTIAPQPGGGRGRCAGYLQRAGRPGRR